MDGGGPKRCGASWALVGLHLLSRPAMLELDRREAILLGCAHLLGLLADRAQRRGEELEERARRAENELRQMKLIRAEDAKANEKVVAIFASHEQTWIAERKSLRLQIRALATQLQSLRHTNEENVSDLNYRIMEAECKIRAKEEALESEAKKREELVEKLQFAEREVEELREEVKKEEQDHFRELQQHKDALAEHIANQGQLEEEMARALEQAEAARQELDLVFEKLSDKIGRMQCDAEQKDKILSALLRKSKVDAAEKQMLLKEAKIAKAKKKQAVLEAEKWWSKWESRHKKVLRSSPYSVEAESSQDRRDELQVKGNKNLLLDYFVESEGKGENVIAAIKCLDQYSNEELSGGELVTHDIQNLQGWVRMETEKYAAILEQKHFTEIEAFTEQMRLKDEKLEAFRWRLLSKDIESKRLQSQIEAHEENLTHLKEENFKLEALLVDREGEVKSLKEQFGFFIHRYQRNGLKHSTASSAREAQAEIDSGLMKKENDEMEHGAEADSARNSYNVTENEILKEATESTSVDTTEHYRDQMVNDIAAVNSTDSSPSTDSYVDSSIICKNEISQEEAKSVDSYDEQQSITLIINFPKQEIEEEKEVPIDSVLAPWMNNSKKDATVPQSIARKESSWKMDIHALGVSYKIKRLKQQLLVLEKLAGMKQITIGDDACDSPKEKKADDNKQHSKGIVLVIHLLNKQVKRFQSLEEKTDDLCRRMHENTGGGNRKERSRVLGNFLEETFQLQRYMVATGQKLTDIQSKITGSISGSDGLDESVGFNMKQFADVIRALFRDIQRGLEVRIARIIGDLEGTLACDGIRHI